MKLVSVELENIRSYERGLARFPDGSVLLSGDIGCGKSTLLLATEFALFGIRRGELPGSSLLRRGKKRGLVRLVFSIDNKEIVVERTLKRTASSVAQDAGRIIIDGVVHDYTPMELKAHILNYLGYPPELLDLQKSLLFRYTVYTPQEHLKSIMWAKPDERLDSLRKAFGVERYRRIQENLDQFLISLRAKKRDLAIIHRDLDKKIRAKSALNGQLKTAKKKIEGLTRDVERVALELDEWKEKKAAIEEQVQLYNNLKVELAREIGNAERIEGQFNNAKDSADTIRSRIEEIDGLKSPTKKSDIELTELIKDADEKIIKCLTDPSGEDESIDALMQEMAEMAESLEQSKEQRTEIAAMLEALQTGKNDLKEAGPICPVCGKELDERHKKKKLQEYDDEIESLKKKQEKVKTRIETLSANISKLREKYKGAQDELVKALGKEKDQLSQLRDALKEYTEKIASRDKLAEEAEAAESYQDTLAKELEEAKMAAMKLKKKIDSLADIEQKKTEIEEQIQLKQDELTEVKTKLSSNEEAKRQFNIRIKDLNQEIKHKKNARKFEDELEAFENWLSQYAMNLAATIERHYMVELKRKFEPMFSDWFNLLVDDEDLDVRIDDEFTPIIEQEGYEAEYENLSGGESASVALAYRLALNKVINTMVEDIKTRDLIILDEPTDGFSNDQMDKIRDVVNGLGAKQTIIVSHEPKIESYVDNIIRISKQDGVSIIHD